MKTHPEAQELALWISRDLSLWRRMVVGRHLASCPACRREVSWLRQASDAFAAEVSALPAGVSWDRLAADMRANIRLGLEAGECVNDSLLPFSSELAEEEGGEAVPSAGRPASWYAGWNPVGWWNESRLGEWFQLEASAAFWAASGTAAVLLVSTGVFWWQRDEAGIRMPLFAAQERPAAAADPRQDNDVVFRTTSDGIVVERAGRSLTLAHGGRAAAAVTVSLNGSMNAKYVDDDTGQVTIHHVYAE